MNSPRIPNFVALPKLVNDPAVDRRNRIIAQLEEQKSLLKNPTYMRSVRTWVKDEHGAKTLLEKKQRILPSWRRQPDGSYIFFVRSGWKTIEFEKGKAGIAARTVEELVISIDGLAKAIGDGQFDQQLAAASAQVRQPAKAKK